MNSHVSLRDNLELLSGCHTACFYNTVSNRAEMIQEFIALAEQKDIQITHIQTAANKRKPAYKKNPAPSTYFYDKVYYPQISSSNIKQILKREYHKSQEKEHPNPGIILELPYVGKMVPLEDVIASEKQIDRFVSETECPVFCMYNQNKYSTKTLLYIFRFHPYVLINGSLIKNSNYIMLEHIHDQTRFFDLELQNWMKTLHEKQTTEHQLIKEKFLFENTIHMNPGSVSIYDSDGHFIMCNQSFRDLFGCEPHPDYSLFTDQILIQDPIHNQLFSELKEGKIAKAPFHMWFNPNQICPEYPDNDILLNGVAARIQGKDGQTDKFMIFHEDITEKENQKLELLKSQTQYEFIFNEVSDGIAYVDSHGIILDVNPALIAMTGIPREELIGHDPKKIIKKHLNPKEVKRVLKEMKHFHSGNSLGTTDILTIEYQDKTFEMKGPLKRIHEKAPENRTILIRDITEQRRIEKSLFSDKEKLDRLIHNKTEDLARLNEQMRMEISERILAEEKLKTYIHDLTFLGEIALQLLEVTRHDDYEFIARKTKELTRAPLVIIFNFNKEKETFKCKHTIGINQKIQDILLLFGQDLQKMEIPFDKLLEKSDFTPSINKFNGGLHDLSGKTIPKNICSMIEKIIGSKKIHILGLALKNEPYGFVALFSKNQTEHFLKPEIIEMFIRMASLALKQHAIMEDLNEAYDSAEQLVGDRTRELLQANYNLQIEINRRKKNESKIRASLKEKDELLKEVHHRVKNNLQIVISLLNMQLRYTDHKETKKILNEYRTRIHSIAMIHESFYKLNNFSEINLKKYLQSLIRHLLKFHPGDPNHIQIKIKTLQQKIPLHIAIPCGIIFNEILINSMQYAFPPTLDRKPKIEILIKRDGSLITILYKDNGIGIPDHINVDSPEGIGLELVNILIKQLNGTMEFWNNQGTVFQFRFDLNQ